MVPEVTEFFRPSPRRPCLLFSHVHTCRSSLSPSASSSPSLPLHTSAAALTVWCPQKGTRPSLGGDAPSVARETRKNTCPSVEFAVGGLWAHRSAESENQEGPPGAEPAEALLPGSVKWVQCVEPEGRPGALTTQEAQRKCKYPIPHVPATRGSEE